MKCHTFITTTLNRIIRNRRESKYVISLFISFTITWLSQYILLMGYILCVTYLVNKLLQSSIGTFIWQSGNRKQYFTLPSIKCFCRYFKTLYLSFILRLLKKKQKDPLSIKSFCEDFKCCCFLNLKKSSLTENFCQLFYIVDFCLA